MTTKGALAISFEIGDSKVDIVPSTSSTGSDSSIREYTEKWTAYYICVNIMDFINTLLVILVTMFILCFSLGTLTDMNLHVALCTVGYVLLMSEAIVVLAGENALTNFLTRRAKSHIHWILQLAGAICTIAGVALMFRNKTVHFKSIHAITGITSVATMLFLMVFGYPVLVAVKLRKLVRPVIIKFGHNFLGITCYVIGMVSQCYGYNYSWLPQATSSMANIQLICTILTALITILSLRGAFASLSRQAVSLFR